jgi:polyhydroxybutyrate depolymerase
MRLRATTVGLSTLAMLALAACTGAPRSDAVTSAASTASTAASTSEPAATAARSTPSAPSSGADAAGLGVAPHLENDTLVTPPGVTPGAKRPLVVFLHGLGATGAGLVRSLDVGPLATPLGFSFVAPDGPKDHLGRRFWNAGHDCCDFDGANPNHVSLIGNLPATLEASGAATFGDVVVVGFSNGAFMAHRLACDVPRVTAIVAFAGAEPGEVDPPCQPAHPVRVVMVHGDADHVVPYAGGPVLGDTTRVVPSAEKGASDWAARNGCAARAPEHRREDLAQALAGDETRIDTYAGCKAPVELWTVAGADHLDVLSPELLAKALGAVLAR